MNMQVQAVENIVYVGIPRSRLPWNALPSETCLLLERSIKNPQRLTSTEDGVIMLRAVCKGEHIIGFGTVLSRWPRRPEESELTLARFDGMLTPSDRERIHRTARLALDRLAQLGIREAAINIAIV